MNRLDWAQALGACRQAGRGHVLATLVQAQGSTPREAGAKMVIDAEHSYDTLGGGQLEFLVQQAARELLARNQSCQQLRPIHLAAEAGQCCGGAVTVLLECFAACDWQLVLFGAGHVAQALTAILGGLPLQARLIDTRPGLFPGQLPANCRLDIRADPVAEVAGLPDGAWVLLLTHDHQLDYRLCQALLADGRARYLGLIGSRTKAARFRRRLQAEGVSDEALARLICPVGLPQVPGKRPMEVAVSIAAQLQSLYYQGVAAPRAQPDSWREIKRLLRAPPAQPHREPSQ